MTELNTYNYLLLKICEIENLDNEKRKNAENLLNNKYSSISELRTIIEENCQEYTDIAYFFIIYFIVIYCEKDDEKIKELELGNAFDAIKNILMEDNIKTNINHYKNDDEYIKKYEKDYQIIINGLDRNDKISKGNVDIAIEKFWKILKELK